MMQFALYALLLIGVVAAFIVPPLWRDRRNATTQADRKAANLAIFRDQLADMEREREAGTLSEADFNQARQELQRRLLEEVDEDTPQAEQGAPARKTALALVILLPILALGGYGVLGNPRALDPTAATARPQMTPEQIEAMVARLAERMTQNPDDMQGWLMLARSYKTLGRHADAAAAYAKAEKVVAEDPDLLSSYAESIAMDKKSFKGKPTQLVEQALRLDPKHGHSLFLAGAAAMEAGDSKKGIAHWEALLPLVEPDSDIDRMLRDGIAKMKQKS